MLYCKKRRMVKTLISTIYEGRAIKVAIKELSPSRVVLIVDEPLNKIRKKTVEEIKKIFDDILEIEILKTSVYDLFKIAKDVVKKIDSEIKSKNQIYVHVSEGRKPVFLGTLFAAYLRRENITGTYYVKEEDNQILSLPLLHIGVKNTKKRLLQELAKGNGKVQRLMEKLDVNKQMVYAHIQDLKKEGYLVNEDKKLELTDFGKICLL